MHNKLTLLAQNANMHMPFAQYFLEEFMRNIVPFIFFVFSFCVSTAKAQTSDTDITTIWKTVRSIQHLHKDPSDWDETAKNWKPETVVKEKHADSDSVHVALMDSSQDPYRVEISYYKPSSCTPDATCAIAGDYYVPASEWEKLRILDSASIEFGAMAIPNRIHADGRLSAGATLGFYTGMRWTKPIFGAASWVGAFGVSSVTQPEDASSPTTAGGKNLAALTLATALIWNFHSSGNKDYQVGLVVGIDHTTGGNDHYKYQNKPWISIMIPILPKSTSK
jgi:hypothetical protein